jgi:hypothetical protein
MPLPRNAVNLRLLTGVLVASLGHLGANSLAGERQVPLLLKPQPDVLHVTSVDAAVDIATITGVCAEDLTGDGRRDLAVAWYATDNDAPATNQRCVSIFVGEGAGFRLSSVVHLYVYNSSSPSLSVFRYGTASLAAGDFDGDGDLDLAVAAFYGDELYFIENLDDETFLPHLKFPFGFNSPGNYVSPPEMCAADFDGDGRDDLVCLIDPIQYPDGDMLHFWRTTRGIADMYRAIDWVGFGSDLIYQWSRSLTVGDFDGDQQPDLVFTATDHDLAIGDRPVFALWYGFNPSTGRFNVCNTFPSIFCADVVSVPPAPGDCAPGFVLTDIDGTTMQYWTPRCDGQVGFQLCAEETGYSGLGAGRGMAGAIADVDGDGDPDLVTKQKRGTVDDWNQLELTIGNAELHDWQLLSSTPFDSTGLQVQNSNGILRPHNLVLADLRGNTLPEVIAGFAASWGGDCPPDAPRTIKLAIWENSCLGDVNRDGRTDCLDFMAIEGVLGLSSGNPLFVPDADLDKDGWVSPADAALARGDSGCTCWNASGQRLGDLNCDGAVDEADLAPFVLALEGPDVYYAAYPECNWLNADGNLDGVVNNDDVPHFALLLCRLDLSLPDH